MSYAILSLFALLGLGTAVFINQPSFGKNPSGARLERIKQSPNYKNGHFENEVPAAVMTGNKSSSQAMWEFLTGKGNPPNMQPENPVPSVKTDLNSLPKDKDYIVWFGHSSYLLQLSGKRILVDPTLISGSPVSFVNRPYKGTDLYKPEDMPDIDFLIITHDHWDHLDYKTVKALKNRTGQIITPLGIGSHFEHWGFAEEMLAELDWEETFAKGGFTFRCMPARHFSGRGLVRNKTLWGSFIVQTPDNKTLFLSGDGGYGPHFKRIGGQYPDMNLAILENGQYNENWSQIHTMPQELALEMRELNAKSYITVHHSKYTLSKHSWDDPLRAEKEAALQSGANLQVLTIGQPEEIR